METFLYFGKVILCSAVMFGYYHLALKDKTFHHYNRFYLLSIVAVSLLLPLLKISYFTVEVNKDIYLLLNSLQNFNSTKTLNNDFIYPQLALLAFGVVALVFLIRLFIALFKISTFKKQFPKEEIQGVSVYNTNLESAPFSYFKNLFWKNSILLNSDLGRQILKHEMVHIEQKHSFDKLFMELVTAILWFNPVFWFIKKEINLIHEYLADKKAVKNMDTKAFAQMLLANHFSGTVIPATSPFLSSNLKKRLKMLQKPNTKFGYAHRILALPVVFTLAFAYMVNAKNKEIEKAVAKIKQDTTKAKATVTAVLVKGEASFSMDEKLKNSTEKSLFIINGDEVSRIEFMKNYEKNKNNKKIVTSYSSLGGNEHLYKEFGVLGPYGEFEKYGVFQMDSIDEMKNNHEKYWKLQDKYAPEWREYLKSLKKPENQARLDRIMAEKDAEILEKTEKQVEEDISALKKERENTTNEKIKQKVSETVEAAKALNKENYDNWKVENNFTDDGGKLKMKIKMEKSDNADDKYGLMSFIIGEPTDKPQIFMLPTKHMKIFVNGKPASQEQLKDLSTGEILENGKKVTKVKSIKKGEKKGEFYLTTY